MSTDDEEADWEENDTPWDDDDEPTLPCPSCRREILEDSPRCPHCGLYISAEDHPSARRPTWVVITALLCLAVALAWAFWV